MQAPVSGGTLGASAELLAAYAMPVAVTFDTTVGERAVVGSGEAEVALAALQLRIALAVARAAGIERTVGRATLGSRVTQVANASLLSHITASAVGARIKRAAQPSRTGCPDVTRPANTTLFFDVTLAATTRAGSVRATECVLAFSAFKPKRAVTLLQKILAVTMATACAPRAQVARLASFSCVALAALARALRDVARATTVAQC
jgi:hypothetical protein